MIPTHKKLVSNPGTFIKSVHSYGLLAQQSLFVNAFLILRCARVHYWWTHLFTSALWSQVACITRLKLPSWPALPKRGFMKHLLMRNTSADWDMFTVISPRISSFTIMHHLTFRSFKITYSIWRHESHNCCIIRVTKYWFRDRNASCHLFGLTTALIHPYLYFSSWITVSWGRKQKASSKNLYLSTYVMYSPRRE